jgi:hypothetical protein
MLVKINIIGSKDDLLPKLEKFSPEDLRWITGKLRACPMKKGIRDPMKMELSEVVQLLTAFNKVEKIFFEVK